MAAMGETEVESRGTGSLDQAFYDKLAMTVGERIKQCGQRVPVVTGRRVLSPHYTHFPHIPPPPPRFLWRRSGIFTPPSRPRIHRFACSAHRRRSFRIRTSDMERGRRNIHR